MSRAARRGASTLGLALILVSMFVVTASPTAAHTGFEASDPADGSTVNEPVSEITLRFSGAAQPAGDGFQVLDPQGSTRAPDTASSADGTTWVLTFDEPLAGGAVGIRWMVQAPDAHPIDGAFSFTVTAPLATGGTGTDGTQGSVEPPVEAGGADPESVSLEEFLASADASSVTTAEQLAAIGRIAGIGGTLLGLGALVFAAAVLRGSARDVRHVVFWIRRAGVVVALGATVRLAGRIVIDSGGDWSALLSPSSTWSTIWTLTGLAIVLRLVGGVLLVAGSRMQLARASDRPDPVVAMRQLVRSGGGVHAPPDGDEPADDGDTSDRLSNDLAWDPRTGMAATATGTVALLLGYLFDGHTVTEGNRLLTAMSDVVHVFAAAVWVGGLLMLVSVLRMRRRHGEDVRALYLAARFSVVAAAALVAVAVSGAILAWIVLDSPSELWSTPWGRLLLAKTAIVAVAAGLGGYNHRILIPAMERSSTTDSPAQRFRVTATIEAGLLCGVVVVTAFLVGAAS